MILNGDTKISYTAFGRPQELDASWSKFKKDWDEVIPPDEMRRISEEIQQGKVAKYDVLMVWIKKP